jgi:RES domain
LRVRLVAVLDLRPPEATAALGLRPRDLGAGARRACQAVGDAAHALGLEGLLAPSAAGPGTVLAVFPDQLLGGSSLGLLGVETWSEPPPRRSGRSTSRTYAMDNGQ